MPLTARIFSNYVPDNEVGNLSGMASLSRVLSVPVEMGTFELRRADYFNRLSCDKKPLCPADLAGIASIDKA